MQPPANLYDDVIYPGGIKATERGTIDTWPPVAQNITRGAVVAEAEYAMNREHPTFDAYWQDRSMLGRHGEIDVPVLTIGGWEDGYFRSGTLANIEAALDRTWAIYGPWPHRNPIDYGDCAACPVDALPSGVLLAWFDHWVMELPGVPIPLEPTFVTFEGPKEVGAGWRELSHWDPSGAQAAQYELSSDGSLEPTSGTSGTVAFREPAEPDSPGGSVAFTTAPLEADRVLLGHPTLQLRAALSAPDANFYVELFDVAPDGIESLVNDGFLKASHRTSHITPEPVTPGATIDYDITVRADHHRFLAGHRVRIRISGGSARTLVAPDPVEVTLHLDGTSTFRLPGF
jgi:predicted acyl esterase